MKKTASIAVLTLIALLASTPSHAGVHVGVALGFDPYYPYYYDEGYYYGSPYYGYPGYPYSYAPYVPVHPVYQTTALTREQVEFQYEDGDISKSERDALLKQIDESKKETPQPTAARSNPNSAEDAAAAAPVLPRMTPLPGTRPAADEVPAHDLKAVKDKLAQVRALLDQKLSEGNITKAQKESEAKYLDQLEKVAQAQAAANNGTISTRQESTLLQELHHVEGTIQNNLVTH